MTTSPRKLAIIREPRKAPVVYLPEGAFGLQDPAEVGIDNIAGEWLTICISASGNITATPWPTDPRATLTPSHRQAVYQWPGRGRWLLLAA